MQYKSIENPDAHRSEIWANTDALIRRSPNVKRVPICACIGQWPIFDAGYTLTQVLTDYELEKQVLNRFHEKYEADFYFDYFARYCVRVQNAMGGGGMLIDDEKGSMYYLNEPLVLSEELDYALESGLAKTYYEKVFPRKFSFSNKEDAMAKLSEALKEQYALQMNNAHLNKHFQEHYGIPSRAALSGKSPIDDFMPTVGMKTFVTTLRRCSHERILDILNVWENGATKIALDNIDKYVASDRHIFGLSLVSVTSTFLALSQFESYHWPWWKVLCDRAVERNMTISIFLEGTFAHLNDILRDLPAGHFNLITEQDDIGALAKQLPNMTFQGGFPTVMLGHSKPQECVDRAKCVIDKCGDQLIFSSDKMLSYPNDCNSENLLALNQFVKEYGKF